MAGWRARGAWRWGGRAVVAAVALLLGAGCSGERPVDNGPAGGRGDGGGVGAIAGESPAIPGELRREFVVLRELVKQYALQSEAGNAERLEAVERHLRERLENLSDDGLCEEERAIAFQVRELVAKMEEQAP